MTTVRHKILFVTPGLRQGGAERQLLELIRRLPDRFESVLCLFENEEMHYQALLPPGQPRHVIGARRMNWKGLARLARIIADERPAILHCYRDRANFWTRLALQLYGVSVPVLVTSVRNRALEWPNLLTESIFAENTDRILCNSIGVRRELIAWARVPEHKLGVIHNFVDLARFRPATSEQRIAARQRLGLASNDRVLLLPGRISFQKHQLGLLWALRRLHRAGRLPKQAHILLAGRERDRWYSRLVRGLIARWKLSDNVRLLGAVSDVLSLYHAADLVLLPSLYEGMPNAAIEALACAVPVLASRAANADGMIVHNETGLEVPTGDSAALAMAIEQSIHGPMDWLRDMGLAGQAHIERMLDNDALRSQFTSLYDDLLKAKSLVRTT